MQRLGLVLLVFSFVCFVIGVWQSADPIWRRLIALGLAFLVAASIFGGLGAMHYIPNSQ
jgi:hypothetical protein